MALGYAKIITETNKLSFEDWLKFLNEEFLLHSSKEDNVLCNYIDNKGDSSEVPMGNLAELFESNRIIILSVKNEYGEGVNCTIQMTRDNCYFLEEYGLDQLTSDISRNSVFDILHSRYLRLHKEGHAIGFIYDRKGYSEDYISFLL